MCFGELTFLDPFCQAWLPGNNCMWLEYFAVGCVLLYGSWKFWTHNDPEGNLTFVKVAMHTIGVVSVALVVLMAGWGDGRLANQLATLTRFFQQTFR